MTQFTELLGGLVAQLADDLVEAKNLVAAAKKEQGRRAKQAEVAAGAAEQWGQRAMSAMRAGDDVVAKDALVRRHECERKADEFRAAFDVQRGEVERLTAALSEQSLRLEQTKQRKNALLLRLRRAGVGPSIDAVGSQASGLSLLDLLARLEAAVAAVEREEVVARELSDEAIAEAGAGAPAKRRAEADLLLLKRLAKAPAFRAAKPLAKTTASNDDASRARAGASRERRTKR